MPNRFIKAIGTDETEIPLEATPVAGEFDQDGNQVYIPSSGATLVGGGDASAANQIAPQANPGADASKAVAIQGVTGGKAIPISGTVDTELPTAAALNGTIAKSLVAPVVGSANMYSDGTNLVEVDSTHPLPIGGAVTDAVEGTTTDAAASSSVAEDTTARTGIGLWKGIKNILINIAALLGLNQGFVIPITLTVTSGAYTIGDVVGGLITIPNAVSGNGKRGIITNINLAGVAALAYNLFFFASDIATPAADNAVGTMVAADIAMCKGVIPIAASDYLAPVSAFNVANLRNVNLEYSCTATTLYAYLIATATTTPGTTTITLTLKGFWLD